MNEVNIHGVLSMDDKEQIQIDVELLLTQDLLERGLFQTNSGSSETATKSDFLLWQIDIGSDEEFISKLYVHALGRVPSHEELQARCVELSQPGACRRYISDAIFLSYEARNRARKMSSNTRILQVYELTFKYYRENLRQIASASIISDDGRTLCTQNIRAIDDPALLVAVAYRDLLGRMPDFSEFQPWANHLRTGNLSKAEFLRQVATSPEGQQRLNELSLSALEKLPDFQRHHSSAGLTFGGLASEVFFLRKSELAVNTQKVSSGSPPVSSAKSQLNKTSASELPPDRRVAATTIHSPSRDISDLRERVLIEIDRRYRGTEESLCHQMEFYRDYLTDVKELGPMLDIGCGRGLLMGLMHDIGARATGIDLSAMQVDYCRANGFDARNVEASEFLREQDDNSYSAVTMLHIVEHLSFDDLLRMLSDIYRVLVPGGILLIETPNPENLFISSVMFHIDPTHVRPVTYQFISTVLSVIGFEAERLPLHMPIHDDAGYNTKNIHLNNILMASGNLSILGRKPA